MGASRIIYSGIKKVIKLAFKILDARKKLVDKDHLDSLTKIESIKSDSEDNPNSSK